VPVLDSGLVLQVWALHQMQMLLQLSSSIHVGCFVEAIELARCEEFGGGIGSFESTEKDE
jgi:hypothetical protein